MKLSKTTGTKNIKLLGKTTGTTKLKKNTIKVVKAWAILNDNSNKIETIWINRWEAIENAKDICFMGSCGLSQKVIPVLITPHYKGRQE